MLHHANFLVLAAMVLALPSSVRASSPPPLCVVSAITRAVPSGDLFEVALKQPRTGASVTYRRVRTLQQAIHFIKGEQRHGACRPAMPAERKRCVMSAFNRQVLISYSSQSAGSRLEPLALYPSLGEANLTLRQMRDAYLCN